MTIATGYYSIIQYCPDPARQEAVNVGVVLFCPEQQYLHAITEKSNDRIKHVFRPKHIDSKQLSAIKMSIEHRLVAERDRFKDLADLKEFAATRANAMQLTRPQVIAIEGAPDDALRQLFERLVGGRPAKGAVLVVGTESAPQSIKAALEVAFSAPPLARIVKRRIPVTLPVFQQKVTVPFGFRNGRYNLIQPASFQGLDAGQILGRAGKFALEGGLFYKNPDPDLGELKLIVVGQFADSQKAIAEAVKDELSNNHTDLYRLDEIDRLVEEIRTKGKAS